ncbi:patatin-like phospholipase family protein [Spirosoma pollinicola]|uniref:PNPLA domain-containing protein n=1 Tax=Spirosoma pollinicola TaxID=2057025 RepID=A0A2K8Z2E8_9BACT|nr:patatin-like phospholipase family protein [Spirosoma pollinicola]AUD04021.1 hypothetical protein CWM47_20635 [Spirosoma pollinicola]
MNRTFTASLRVLIGIFIPISKKGLILLGIHWNQLSVRILLKDFLSVASSIGFVILPAFLTGVLFIFLPQGRDTLLIVVEKLKEGNILQLMFLLLSLFGWSVAAELGVRYAIAISDNSGKNLSDARVEWRKSVQKGLAAFFLLWPYLLIMSGLSWCFAQTKYQLFSLEFGYFSGCLVLVYGLMLVTANLYFRKFGQAKPGNPFRTAFGARSLPPQELFWLSKLNGIYEDYIYTLPKASTFKADYKTTLSSFTQLFVGDTHTLTSFLQNPDVVKNDRLIPRSFTLLNPDSILFIRGRQRGGVYKWIYFVPTSFYRGLHRQVNGIALGALVLFTGISLLTVESGIYGSIGSPALVCLAFGCYSGMYTGLLYLDHALLRKWFISVRFSLLILLIVSSCFNNDHPARIGNQPAQKRLTIAAQFKTWFHQYKAQIEGQNSATSSTKKYPVIFICSEGGAFRTGAYTGLYLTRLDDTLTKTGKLNLRQSIFAMSGVSGGAIGLGLYNALAYRSKSSSDQASGLAKRFFAYDALSPIIGKLLYGELLNLFIPVNIDRFNRATALEKAWEVAYGQTLNRSTDNTFGQDFLSPIPRPLDPLFIINTTEVETGLQCWISTAQADSMAFATDRDLLQRKIRNRFRYSTALNFSSRFPLFSPGAAVDPARWQTALHGSSPTSYLHYVDGGYVENTGASSLLDVLTMLKAKAAEEFKQVIPIIIFLKFSDDTQSQIHPVRFANELAEVLFGIYNTRQGRSRTSEEQLRQFVTNHQGWLIAQPIRAGSSSVPMSWVLSTKSIDSLSKDIQDKLIDSSGVLKQLLRPDLSYLLAHSTQ